MHERGGHGDPLHEGGDGASLAVVRARVLASQGRAVHRGTRPGHQARAPGGVPRRRHAALRVLARVGEGRAVGTARGSRRVRVAQAAGRFGGHELHAEVRGARPRARGLASQETKRKFDTHTLNISSLFSVDDHGHSYCWDSIFYGNG